MHRIRLLSAISLCCVAVAFSSCSSDDIMTETVDDVIDNITEVRSDKITFVDSLGNALKSVSPEFGKYYLKIQTEGKWSLHTDDAFLVILEKEGCGDTVVPVLVGENWYETRHARIRLITTEQNGCTRSTLANDGANNDDGTADSESIAENSGAQESTTVDIVQDPVDDLLQVKKHLSSNRGAGYGYNFSGDYCLGTTIEIFNMLKMESLQGQYGSHFIEDDFYPQMMQEVYTGSSKEDVDNQLAISASLGVNYNGVSVKVSGSYGQTDLSSVKKSYSRMRMLGSQFTREINYLNCVALAAADKKKYEEIFSPGFRRVVDEFVASLTKAGTEQEKTDKVCQDFINVVGPCFITKSLMGCSLDYSMSFTSDSLAKGMTASGALEIKVQFATGSVDVKASGKYTNEVKSALSNSEATCSLRGGDVNIVSILSSGGSINESNGESLSKWQLSVKPYNSVMINMNTAPIYSLIIDDKAREVLREYITRKTTVSTDTKQETTK